VLAFRSASADLNHGGAGHRFGLSFVLLLSGSFRHHLGQSFVVGEFVVSNFVGDFLFALHLFLTLTFVQLVDLLQLRQFVEFVQLLLA
jgi:hypothetical protein